MIIQVGKPEFIREDWAKRLTSLNTLIFNFKDFRLIDHWWWVAIENNKLCGFAGAFLDTQTWFLGPCGVLEENRGRGLQRAFIRRRMALGRRLGWSLATTYTDIDNYYSANNFVREGFLLGPPWREFDDADSKLFFRKPLQ